ncbi:GAF domain-containing protein [Paraburkholderia edwinii]|jgi:two-component sensor histidine kinase|uniref:histidine kinase n=1 Tax=Paraburkholderia edwinii TaxID=2861782 RepID=A0ABX8UI06_9BURK|nr:histidine kinase dimerization/phosphoacceptor domain -containing protein [Paraburkholderia edwinii]QYD66987.1 GAF domain-containing protein [Paraburkholderia edwinii]
MGTAQAATLAASLSRIVADPNDMVSLSDVLRQRQLIARMIEASQGEAPLQQVLNGAVHTAAQGCPAPMAKILEIDRTDDTLVLKSQCGMPAGAIGRTAGKAVEGNPAGEALKNAEPVIDIDVRRRPPESLPDILKDNNVVTSVSLPLINHDGPYGILEVDFPEPTQIGAFHISFLAVVAGVLADNIEKIHARAALIVERDAKAVLLREQQHRIRNNFQLIIAMVQRSVLQTTDDGCRKNLRDIERRVFAMASLYDHLLGLSVQAERADLGRYLSAMAASFDDFYALRTSGIALKIELQFGIDVDLDTCTTVGTIVNELVANSVEHAFGGSEGQITVSMTREADDLCAVTISDNGHGLPAAALESTGLRTVRLMLNGIGGRLDVQTAPERGVKWSILFSDTPPRKRGAAKP